MIDNTRVSATDKYFVGYEFDKDGKATFVIEWPQDEVEESCAEILSRIIQNIHSGTLDEYVVDCLTQIQFELSSQELDKDNRRTYNIVTALLDVLSERLQMNDGYISPLNVFADGTSQWRSNEEEE